MLYRSLNPATEEVVAAFPTATDGEVDAALARADGVFRAWRRSSFAERCAVNERLADLLEAQADDLAGLMALEMGKPLAQGVAEARKCAWVARHYAQTAEDSLRPRRYPSDGSDAYVRFDPIGPILAVMPWNFPLWQVIRVSAPNFVTGNPMVLKHAPSVPQCALRIVELYREAGAPEGLIQNVFLTNDQAASCIGDRRIRGVSLTGSSRAGSEVAAVAGRHLKPMVAELGGSDPFIVFEDSDVEEAAAAGAGARLINSGQSCIAAKRFLVQRTVLDSFLSTFETRFREAAVGDPLAPETSVGPLAREDLRDRLEEQVARSVSGGTDLLYRGTAPARGFFSATGILAAPPAGTPAADEELFGPVATVAPFDDEAEAVEIANRTNYGLGASLWTSDPRRADRLVPQIESGAVFVNGITKSDPRVPFGGTKDSGFGRELGPDGLTEFTNRKTVWIR
jgi:succinate-semialdehyde dehydrogenase/glutarate-semialdehyde dehydrogenase